MHYQIDITPYLVSTPIGFIPLKNLVCLNFADLLVIKIYGHGYLAL